MSRDVSSNRFRDMFGKIKTMLAAFLYLVSQVFNSQTFQNSNLMLTVRQRISYFLHRFTLTFPLFAPNQDASGHGGSKTGAESSISREGGNSHLNRTGVF